jgi:hypothetical protein
VVSALVAALLLAASPADTVYTADGSRITGTILEESQASGVTIQTPDGSVRKIDRNQVVRIEFADGSVSTPRASPPPPAQVAPAQAPPAPRTPATPGVDSVYLTGSGRARGTVMEESATTGVKVRLLDGTIRIYRPEEVARIEYSDGTISTLAAPRTPEPAPRAKPGTPLDTAYFVGGGRVRGTVIEENPKTGVKVRLLDGATQVYSPADVQRIEYADGTVSQRVPPAPPPPAVPPPPQAEQRRPLIPFYLTLGVGATFLGGDAARDVRMSEVVDTEQAHLSAELGLRLTPPFALGIYADVGGGEPASAIDAQCKLDGSDCVGTTGRVGFLVRHTWAPLSRRAPWLSLGTGWEFGGVTIDRHGAGSDSNDSDLIVYTGREYLRVGAGIDFRTSRVIGFGLYGSFAVGEYSRRETPTTTVSVERRTHTTGQVGIRLILFP